MTDFDALPLTTRFFAAFFSNGISDAEG